MENRRTWLVSLAALVASALVATDVRAGCNKRTDCSGDEICQDGRCATAAAKAVGKPSKPDSGGQADGAIRVTSTYPGTVFLDGGQVGRVDAKPYERTGVLPGSHQIEVETPTGVSGFASVTVSAGDCSRVHVVVPPEDYASSRALIAGAILMASGFAATMVGAPITGTGLSYDAPSATGTALLVGGLVVLVSGTVMLALGAHTVPATDDSDESATLVQPLIGPTGGGLRVKF